MAVSARARPNAPENIRLPTITNRHVSRLTSESCDGLAEIPTDYAIANDEVHVWCARIGVTSLRISALADLLSADERQKAERFRLRADCHRHIIGRALARLTIGRLLDHRAESLRFRYTDFGKPYLADKMNERGVQFNISHSGDVVLVALTTNRRIGVDVERIRDDLNVERIAGRFFSARECSQLAALPDNLRRTAFFRCWSRKEAFIKARGEGLSLPLDSFDVSLGPTERPAILATRPDPTEADRWVLHSLEVGHGHQAALAVEGTGWQLETMNWCPKAPEHITIRLNRDVL